MFAILITDFFRLDYYWNNPWLFLVLGFQIWMLVDAIRKQEWFWAVFIFIFPLFNAILYYFLVYRPQRAASPTRGFELPGTHSRNRIKELQGQIHHLDKAHHHAELGDIYFQKGDLKEAEKAYRAALERDPDEIDYQAHLGQCLLRQNRIPEAKPLLESVVREQPKHDYGHTLMAYAETLAKLGEKDAAMQAWLQVLESHSYPRARVQLAELYIEKGEKVLARKEVDELLADEAHAASFEKKREKVWVQRAKSLKRQLA